MPTWGEILHELQETQAKLKVLPFDAVRRKYLVMLHARTGRNTVLYATKWTQPGQTSPELISITEEDVQGLMEVIHQLHGTNLDLILHSPGGSPEAAEAFVSYLRSKFTDIRVIVPHLAMSAATMIACSANRIMMGKHSFLGPIDPQLILRTPLGVRSVPAQAIVAQFDKAVAECADQKKLAAWLPILGQYGPDLLIQCDEVSVMSTSMVREWLEKYMFAADEQRTTKADSIATWLGTHSNFRSHSKHIPRDEAESKGLVIDYLEKEQDVQDLVLSVFHATTHTFTSTAAVKIIENHKGKAFIKQHVTAPMMVPTGAPPSGSLQQA